MNQPDGTRHDDQTDAEKHRLTQAQELLPAATSPAASHHLTNPKAGKPFPESSTCVSAA